MAQLTDLPLEILLLVAQHINTAADFRALCATCHPLQDAEDFRYAPAFWSGLIKDSFRVPNQPVVEADGRRWCHLYRRMLKETQVYVWGNNDKGSLGKAPSRLSTLRGRVRGPRIVRHSLEQTQRNAAWPQEISHPEDVKVVADLQCGGWSTAILTSSGKLYLTGMLDQQHPGVNSGQLEELLLPEEHNCDRVRQFSLGRAHLLALGDSGNLYSWDTTERRGRRGVALTFPTLDRSQTIAKVVGGWQHSSCFMLGTGIVVWTPGPERSMNAQSAPQPLSEIHDFWVVPHTDETSKSRKHGDRTSSSPGYGAVVNWTILEGFLLWSTDLGNVFAVQIPSDLGTVAPDPLNLTRFTQTSESRKNDLGQVIDVQGNLRRFAVLKRTGEVLTSTNAVLEELWANHMLDDVTKEDEMMFQPRTASFQKIPALQHTGVIQVVFGDWHFHALHADGTVSSYGTESQFCGVLGLGGDGIDAVRGIKAHGFGGDGTLLPQCMTTGRRVWFEEEKKEWMNHIRTGGPNRREAEERMNMMYDNDSIRAEVSEWFEDRLRNWEHVLSAEDTEEDPEDDGLPAFYTLSVAAAGWHSGALVLRNETKARRIVERYKKRVMNGSEGQSLSVEEADGGTRSLLERTQSMVIDLGRSFLGLPEAGQARGAVVEESSWTWEDEVFPRLRLKSGASMPGEVPVEEWIAPEWREEESVRQSQEDSSAVS